MRPARVFVVGSLNVDLTVYLDRRPGPGQTVLGGDLHTGPGGKGANQAVAAARYGGPVTMLGRVGDDQHGRLLRHTLGAAGVTTSHVRTCPDRPTGAALITVTADGENAIVVSPGANAAVTNRDLAAATPEIREAGVLLCQLELPLPVVTGAARVAAGHTRLVLNAAPPQRLPKPVLVLCDPLVVNRHEASALLGWPVSTSRMAEAVQQLLGLGPRSVVVTMGGDGAMCADAADGVLHVPAPRVPVVDTTGAGDAFVGVLAAALADGRPLRPATQLAVWAGAAAVQAIGAQPPEVPHAEAALS